VKFNPRFQAYSYKEDVQGKNLLAAFPLLNEMTSTLLHVLYGIVPEIYNFDYIAGLKCPKKYKYCPHSQFAPFRV
jgi:hypothetical protein